LQAGESRLGLAAFLTWLKNTSVPVLILSMSCAEPSPADTAMERCGGVAGFVHWRNGLTRPLEVPGFCLIHLLQHVPSSCGQYTPGEPQGLEGRLLAVSSRSANGNCIWQTGLVLQPNSRGSRIPKSLLLAGPSQLIPEVYQKEDPTCPSLRSSPSA